MSFSAFRYLRSAIFLFTVFSVIFSFFLSSSGGVYPEDGEFFSYKRFILDKNIAYNLKYGGGKGAGRTRRDLERFADFYVKGTDALQEGWTEDAIEKFAEARRIWPEYFGTDFLLALSYDRSGDHKKGARYYKSYLNKLEAYHTGQYRISAPLIKQLTPSGIESHGLAQALVKDRLDTYGIDLAYVRPAVAVPDFVIYIFIFTAFIAVFYSITRWYIPYYKEQKRMNNPPDGFWACRKCHTMNPVLNKVCSKCGAEPEEK